VCVCYSKWSVLSAFHVGPCGPTIFFFFSPAIRNFSRMWAICLWARPRPNTKCVDGVDREMNAKGQTGKGKVVGAGFERQLLTCVGASFSGRLRCTLNSFLRQAASRRRQRSPHIYARYKRAYETHNKSGSVVAWVCVLLSFIETGFFLHQHHNAGLICICPTASSTLC
jgi:hypothetical protein